VNVLQSRGFSGSRGYHHSEKESKIPLLEGSGPTAENCRRFRGRYSGKDSRQSAGIQKDQPDMIKKGSSAGLKAAKTNQRLCQRRKGRQKGGGEA